MEDKTFIYLLYNELNNNTTSCTDYYPANASLFYLYM